MKKITFLLFAFIVFTWQSNAQVLTEGFESGAIPTDWTQEYVSGTTDWGVVAANQDGSITPRTGGSMAEMRTTIAGDATRLITPALDLTTLANPQLIFYYANSNWFGDIDELRVYYKSSVTGTWTQIGIDYTEEQATWKAVKLLLPEASNDYYIAFEATSRYARGLDLDDVTVAEGPTCVTTVVDSSTLVDDCDTLQFYVDVVVSTVGDGTVITDGLGGSFPVASGTVTAGPYTGGEVVTLMVEHSDSDCDFSLGDFQTECTLPGSECSNPIVIEALPYNTIDNTANYGNNYSNGDSPCDSYFMSGDDVVYSFTPANDGNFKVSLSDISDTYSGIHVLDNCPGNQPNCVGFAGNSDTSDRVFDVTLDGGTTYFIVISTWATPQSTAYTLDITENTCTPATVDYTTVNDCDGSGGFFIDVAVTNMGSATDLTISDDQGSASQALTALGTLQFGPYDLETDVIITIEDDNDASCNLTSSAITQEACPPNCAITPFPADGAVDVPVGNLTFTWEAPTSGIAPTSYNLYAGETPSGNDYGLIANYTGLSADLTISGYSTEIFWIVKPVNGSTEASGCPILSFTTLSAPAGALCEDSIEVTSLPYSTTDDTSLYGNDYLGADVPNIASAQYAEGTGAASYISGDDVVYAFTPDANGTYNFNLSNTLDDWVGFWLFEDCPFTSVVAYHTATSGTTRSLPDIELVAGTTYYVVISTWAPPQSTPYKLDITLEALGVEDFQSQPSLTYHPNPVSNTLTLKAQQNIQDVAVYNMLGQEVLRVAPNSADSALDMSNLETGAYFVKVSISNITKTIRVIKF